MKIGFKVRKFRPMKSYSSRLAKAKAGIAKAVRAAKPKKIKGY